MINILIVGSGGREHALGWKLSASPGVDSVYFAPGNGGTKNNVDVKADDIEKLAQFAEKNRCLTVVGPETPLAMGIVDAFEKKGLPIFGPTRTAAQLESSKIWAKNFMKRNGIPTARFEIFDEAVKAKEYAKSVNHPLVVKADGLAAGKGVVVCSNQQEVIKAIDEILVEKKYGSAGNRIILEEKLDGIELSYIAISDGNTAYPMATSQDHKRAYDGDLGPNTGGMGAYSPAPIVDDDLAKEIQQKIIEKTISSMKKEGIPFKGFLYAGIMISEGKPFVLEFNARMGDPECQPIMVRMKSDLLEYVQACIHGNLSSLPEISWDDKSAVCVVMVAKGYPESYPKGEEILGLDVEDRDSIVFHAGTRVESGRVLTDGGRVLGITATGNTLQEAISKAYRRVSEISWPSKFCRTDIGKKGIVVTK
ncbi:MAG: phosphoribosylamine--glycine ligase [Thaumarchaeota archaeon]|nr:phosphoribosylamine--glycine ligase [Nitrososphaerota archaeon]